MSYDFFDRYSMYTRRQQYYRSLPERRARRQREDADFQSREAAYAVAAQARQTTLQLRQIDAEARARDEERTVQERLDAKKEAESAKKEAQKAKAAAEKARDARKAAREKQIEEQKKADEKIRKRLGIEGKYVPGIDGDDGPPPGMDPRLIHEASDRELVIEALEDRSALLELEIAAVRAEIEHFRGE